MSFDRLKEQLENIKDNEEYHACILNLKTRTEEAQKKMEIEKKDLKRSSYDDALYAEIAAEKQRKTEADQKRVNSLRISVPLPTEEAMEEIIKDIHKGIVETGNNAELEFPCYSTNKEQGIIFFYIDYPWLDKIRDWLEETKNTVCNTASERSLLAKHAEEGVRMFFQHICDGYNKKHSASRAETCEGGFVVYY